MRTRQVKDRESLKVEAEELAKAGLRISWINDDEFRAYRDGRVVKYVKVAATGGVPA